MAWFAIAIGAAIIAFLIRNELRAAKVSQLPGPLRIPVVGHIPYLLKAPWLQVRATKGSFFVNP